MTRVDLVKTIEGFGCVLSRHGGMHAWYTNPTTGVSRAVPRHREIAEGLARRIVRLLGNATNADDDSVETDNP